ncbi:MAG: hypothetical protein QM811_08325 [Pirellulales bacterium]
MAEIVVKQRANVYTVMLVVSFLCMSVACLFLYLETQRWPGMKVPAELKASNAEAEAKKASAAAVAAPTEEAPMEPMDPMPAEPMPGEPAPMPADGAAPMPADGAAPAAAMPAENM